HEYTIKFSPGTDSLIRSAQGKVYTYTGNMPDVTGVKYTQRYTLRNTFAIPGYEFDYWENTRTGETYANLADVSKLQGEGYGELGENKEVTIKAHWKPVVYDVTLVRNDSSNNNGSTKATVSIAGVATTNTIVLKATFDHPYPAEVRNTGDHKADRDGYIFTGWSATQQVNYASRSSLDYIIDANDYYETVGNSEVYALWKNKPITARLYAETRDFGGQVATWTGTTQIVDDHNPVTHTVYYDLPFGAFSDEGYNLHPTALERPYMPGTSFVDWFVPQQASQGKPNWDGVLNAEAITDYTRITDGATLFKNYSIVKEVGGNLYVDLYGLWGASLVDLYFVSTWSDIQGDSYKINVSKSVSKGARIGDIPNNTRTGYSLDHYWSYATMSDSNPASPSTATQPGEAVPIEPTTIYWDAVRPATVYATWIPNTYTVQYNINIDTEGDSGNPITWVDARTSPIRNVPYTFDSFVDGSTMPIPRRNGYTFLYWYPQSNPSKHYDPAVGFTMDMYNTSAVNNTLVARWSPTAYVVTYDMWGGDDHYQIGESTPSLATAITNGDGVTYDAGFVGKVTASVIYNQALRTGFVQDNIPQPTRPGYDFGGWYAGALSRPMYGLIGNWTADTAGNTDNGWQYPVDQGTQFKRENFTGQSISNVTIYAKWIPRPVKVRYHYAEPSGIFVGGDYLQSNEMEKTRTNDYVVFGQTYGSIHAKSAIKNTPNPNPPAALTGNIYSSNARSVTGDTTTEYHAYPVGIAPQTLGDDAKLRTIREGYDFIGYNTKADGTGEYINPAANVSTYSTMQGGNYYLDVYAIFEPRTYNVTFVTNTNEDNSGDTTSGNEYYDIAFNDISFTKADGTQALQGYTITATMNETVFDATNLPTVTAPYGYTFDGWYTRNGADGGLFNTADELWGDKINNKTFNTELESLSNGYVWGTKATEDNNLKGVARDIKLYAKWKRATYQVSWDGNQGVGSTIPRVRVTDTSYNTLVYGLPYNIVPSTGDGRSNFPTAERVGYTLRNWNFDPNVTIGTITAGTKFTPTAAEVAADGKVHINAIWEKKTYTLYLDYNTQATKAPAMNPSYENANDHANDIYNFITPENNRREYTIRFDEPYTTANVPVPGVDGVADDSVRLRITSGVDTYEGFTFKNWAFSTNGDYEFNQEGFAPVASDMLNNDLVEAGIIKSDSTTINLYAIWTEKTYTLDIINSRTGYVQRINDIPFNAAQEIGPGGIAFEEEAVNVIGSEFKGLDAIGEKTSNAHYNLINGKVTINRLSDNIATLYSIFSLANYNISYRTRLINDTESVEFKPDGNYPTWYNYQGTVENDITVITDKPTISRQKF
ncbi:MAG: InlB B-repeat-containing protein, partial [Lachnospiraceae bacterium]|nr:InlB B-repeat-containing protein [Lachnospiraceae bacterium]